MKSFAVFALVFSLAAFAADKPAATPAPVQPTADRLDLPSA
jgi:hypothetical protein